MPFPSLREYARLHRGVLMAAPVFWAAFTIFLSPWYGLAGFAIHFFLCLPDGKTARTLMLLAYPVSILWFSARDPSLTLAGAPFHCEPAARDAFRFWKGEVADFPSSSNGGGCSLLLNTGDTIYRVYLPNGKSPDFGSTVLLMAREEPAEQPSNPGQRNQHNILRAQGVTATLKAEAWTELRVPSAWKVRLARLRVRLGKSLEQHIPAPVLPLVAAALLNDTRGVSPETQQDFLRSGMQHILAISGQHIGLLIAFLLLSALCLRLPRKFAFLAAGALTAIYIPVTGAPVSVARAGLMLACLLPAILLERPSSGLNAFCLAATVDLFLSPFHILNLGFQLSYAATLALILCAAPGRYAATRFKNPLIGNAAQMLFLSAMVTAFTYPVLAASTHVMAPWSLIGNLVTIPVSSVMLIGGLCTWAFSPFPLLAHWTGAFTGLFSLLLESCVHWLARFPGALWPIAGIGAALAGPSMEIGGSLRLNPNHRRDIPALPVAAFSGRRASDLALGGTWRCRGAGTFRRGDIDRRRAFAACRSTGFDSFSAKPGNTPPRRRGPDSFRHGPLWRGFWVDRPDPNRLHHCATLAVFRCSLELPESGSPPTRHSVERRETGRSALPKRTSDPENPGPRPDARFRRLGQ
jgi:ComEC/Rec2-related protein